MKTARRTMGLALVLWLATTLAGLAQESRKGRPFTEVALQSAADDAKPDADAEKPLATVKQEDGLIVEVLEARQTKNETFMIRWRYRNPTKETVELIAATPPFVGKDSPENTARKFLDSVYYLEGKFVTDSAYSVRPLWESEARKKRVAKDLGRAAIKIRPGNEFECWAQFPPPPHKDTKTITLHIMRTPLIKNIRVQSAEK